MKELKECYFCEKLVPAKDIKLVECGYTRHICKECADKLAKKPNSYVRHIIFDNEIDSYIVYKNGAIYGSKCNNWICNVVNGDGVKFLSADFLNVLKQVYNELYSIE